MNWRDGFHIIGVLVTGVAACGCPPALGQDKPPTAVCGTAEIARATASHTIDGRTFVLGDGREVRLAGIEVPPLQQAPQPGAAAGGMAARDALDALAGGDTVLLRQAEFPSDRYGRIVAYAYTLRDGDELFVQGELVASGFAQVGDRIGNSACATELLGRETAARRAKLGLWANPAYDVINAETPTDVLAHRGRFALVEGKVVSVRESGSTIYLNFGRRWSEDFAVTILKRNERNFAAAGLDLKGLEGRRVRVRGFIEARGRTGDGADGEAGGVGANLGASPRIEAERPGQIETLDRD
jgi:endonuclease YncB( thermonuclease family)